ncbi:hypothetical protein N7450_006608 [Penicillium hetheringtonii]|uniref:Uncharacterized protein n=1 Tax=Penicillium hetheringtonii TaxID=911720 RepID=A0AAD6DIX3_9EURO|nr:hypothetical protein N7450_006608 [Penicillium hetheringtonii]
MPDSTLLKIAGYGSLFVAIKHAEKNSNPFDHFKTYLISHTRVVQSGGIKEVFNILLLSRFHLKKKWHFVDEDVVSLKEPLQRAMAALLVLIAWASSAWYVRRGVRSSGILTGVAGLLQAWAALH